MRIFVTLKDIVQFGIICYRFGFDFYVQTLQLVLCFTNFPSTVGNLEFFIEITYLNFFVGFFKNADGK